MSRPSVPSRQMKKRPLHNVVTTSNGPIVLHGDVLQKHATNIVKQAGNPYVWTDNYEKRINPYGNARRLAEPGYWENEKETNNNIQRVKTIYRQAMRKMYSHLNIDYKEIEKSILYENVDSDTIVLNLMGAIRHKCSQENIVMEEENDDMSVSNTTITELSGSLYTPSTSSGDEMDNDSESEYSESEYSESDDVSSYHPQREVKNMAKNFGYDDETSSFGSSIMTVEMEDESEYSESEEEVGF
jgi:hypothetical protein